MDRLKASFRFADHAVEVCRCPVDGANHLVCFVNDAAHDPDVHNAKISLALTAHPLDGDSVALCDLGGSLLLIAFLIA